MATGSTLDLNIADRLLARFIGPSTTSLNQGSTDSLADFCHYLNPAYKHPSRQKLTDLVCDEATRAKITIKNIIERIPVVRFRFLWCYLTPSF